MQLKFKDEGKKDVMRPEEKRINRLWRAQDFMFMARHSFLGEVN